MLHNCGSSSSFIYIFLFNFVYNNEIIKEILSFVSHQTGQLISDQFEYPVEEEK